jgi:hypothetical protein
VSEASQRVKIDKVFSAILRGIKTTSLSLACLMCKFMDSEGIMHACMSEILLDN